MTAQSTLWSRRRLLQGSLGGAALLFGGSDLGACPDPLEGGTQMGEVAFIPPPIMPLNTKMGTGWDARLCYDLAELTPDTLITPNDRFFIRTGIPDQLDFNAPWRIRMHGHVDAERALTLEEVYALEKPQGVHLLECAGNAKPGAFGLMSAAAWSGAPLVDLLSKVKLTPKGKRVLISGFDQHSRPPQGGESWSGASCPGASWIFTFDEIQGAFLATRMNGTLLPKDHGFPVRLFVPGWYGCACIKWVNDIKIVDDEAPATSHMQEFASRTHQDGVPGLAKDYLPATIDQAAMPVRIERCTFRGERLYRVVGVVWGGQRLTNALAISFDGGRNFSPVDLCPRQETNWTWTLWSHPWQALLAGIYMIRMRITDPSIPTRRLDVGYYDREFVVSKR